MIRHSFQIRTRARSFHELDGELNRLLADSGIREGLCVVFVHHTSASLLLCENADPDVRRDLETWMRHAVPDGDPMFRHSAEGPDDMPSHIRSVLCGASLSIPVAEGRLDLGTWQGVYLWEHRSSPHRRRLSAVLLD